MVKANQLPRRVHNICKVRLLPPVMPYGLGKPVTTTCTHNICKVRLLQPVMPYGLVKPVTTTCTHNICKVRLLQPVVPYGLGQTSYHDVYTQYLLGKITAACHMPYGLGQHFFPKTLVIRLPSAESSKKDCCPLQAKYVHKVLVNCLFKLAQEKSVVK